MYMYHTNTPFISMESTGICVSLVWNISKLWHSCWKKKKKEKNECHVMFDIEFHWWVWTVTTLHVASIWIDKTNYSQKSENFVALRLCCIILSCMCTCTCTCNDNAWFHVFVHVHVHVMTMNDSMYLYMYM